MKSKILALGLIIANVLYSCPQLLAAPAAPLLPAVDHQIGIVAAVRGVVKVSSPEKVGKVIASGESIYLGDEISTDGQGNLQILLLDETIFTIGPNSAMVIDKFVYNPASHDGEVKAKIVKGVFRFVTGKIGQKNPKQVEVDLPSGTIGIRGTIVAGEVTGKKSTVILFGPGENNNTRHRTGSFVLTNKADGKNHQELVNKTGFGSTIEGEGFAPTKPFQVPSEQMARVAKSLGPVSANEGQVNTPQVQGGEAEGSGGGNASATERSGQAKAQGGQFAKQSTAIGKIVQNLGDASDEASQDNTEKSDFRIQNGPTSLNQLQALAQIKGGGKGHYSGTANLNTGGTANFSIDIDFGSRTVGGGNSNVNGNLESTGSKLFQFELPAQNFGFGSGNAGFNFNGLANQNTSTSTCHGSDCATANVSLGIDNVGGGIGNGAHMNITIFDNGGSVHSTGSTTGSLSDGASV